MHMYSEASPVTRPKSGAVILKELQSIAGNEVCADCGMENPKWAR